MRFIAPYPYATMPQQNAENIREIIDGLADGKHDVSLQSAVILTGTASNFYIGNLTGLSANITSAVIGSATIARFSGTDGVIGSAYITTGTAVGWYANLLRVSSVRILEAVKNTASTAWETPEKYFQIATGLWCPVISATL